MNRERSPRPFEAGRSTRYILLSGLVWGFLVTTAESLSQPPLDLSLPDFVLFYARILLHYGAAGVLLAWLTAWAGDLDGRMPDWVMIPALLASAMAFALLIDRLSIWYVPFWTNETMAMGAPTLPEIAAHLAWMFGVYGGLYVLTFSFLQSETRTRERLRQTELARIRTETLMERALTEDRSPAVAPDLLLRALSELARRYDENNSRATSLLDTLVQLLRSASGATGQSARRRKTDLAVNLDKLRAELRLPGEESPHDDVNVPTKEADHERIED